MSKNPAKPGNPYASAAGAYDQNAQAHTPDQRELEARVLLKAVRKMQDLQEDWEKIIHDRLDETLHYNRQIWLMFYDAALENADGTRPNDLRSNIINLSNFVFKRTVEILANPEKRKMDALIDINRDIAAGLMSGLKAPVPGSDSQGATEADRTSTSA
ncbi:MAG TPA: flagellar biosynthesis regulator FlaF [Alphaproteobacteria bacterium]|nr:flagellar biosynthesis regulator FlaF [Alphaproteobacteria bacterium]